MAIVNTEAASYDILNARDIKDYIIEQLKKSDNPAFKDVEYVGSNMNAFIDTLAVMFQQLLFHFSLSASETTFSTAQLYESMNKLVSILNYKTMGRQTSMLPVQIHIRGIRNFIDGNSGKLIIPRFLTIEHNYYYILKNEIVYDVDNLTDEVFINAIMFQGSLNASQNLVALGDEYETFILKDGNNGSGQFITDNFFHVFVKSAKTGKYRLYQETTSLFNENERTFCYEKRFNDQMNYEFKFGNGIYGHKLEKGDEVIIFYVVSNGEDAIVSNGVMTNLNPSLSDSVAYKEVMNNLEEGQTLTGYEMTDETMGYITINQMGDSTPVTYPESVESMRVNAPKVFASQNRLFSLADYRQFIMKNFNSFCKDIYMCTNDTYTKYYLDYFYNLGLDAPQRDSRINLSQVEFQTSCAFNNVYAFILPRVNTIVSGKVPNYLNTTIKQEIVTECEPFKGLAHNLVPCDPIYRAVCFGSYKVSNPTNDESDWNAYQLETQLVVVRDKLSKYSYNYIKEQAIGVITSHFNNLFLGSMIDLNELTRNLSAIPGVKRFYMRDRDNNTDTKLTFYYWNPLYIAEDHAVTQQNIYALPFVYNYFYDLNNISNKIIIEDE